MRQYHLTLYAALYLTLGAIGLILAKYALHPTTYLIVVLLQSAGILTVPAAFVTCRRLFDTWIDLLDKFVEDHSLEKQDVTEWVRERLDFFQGSRGMIVTGIVFGGAVTCVYWWSSLFQMETVWARAITLVLTFIAAAVAGMGLHAVWRAARLYYAFGKKFSVKLSAHKYGVLSTGSVVTRQYIVVIAVWALYVLSAVLSNSVVNITVLLVAIPVAFFMIISYVQCQIPLHVQMRSKKIAWLHECEIALDELRSLDSECLDDERRNKIDYLQQEHKRILALPEWPFSLSGFAEASFASIVPVALPILLNEEIWSQLHQIWSHVIGA